MTEEPTFAEHLRRKAAATDDIGDATDFAQAASELQSRSDRIAVLEGENTRLREAYLSCNNRATLTKEGQASG